MKRLAASAALAAVTVLALPVAPAYACSPPTGFFDVSPHPLVAGGRARLTGSLVADANGTVPPCVTPTPPTPAPTESETPDPVAVTAEPMPSPSSSGPLVSLPPLVPVAFRTEAPITVSIEPWHEYDEPAGPSRALGTIPANPTRRWGDPSQGLYEHSFDGRVTIPGDLAPGEYMLVANQRGGTSYGYLHVEVVAGLADTGGATAGLVRLGLLSVAAGAAALVAGRRSPQPRV